MKFILKKWFVFFLILCTSCTTIKYRTEDNTIDRISIKILNKTLVDTLEVIKEDIKKNNLISLDSFMKKTYRNKYLLKELSTYDLSTLNIYTSKINYTDPLRKSLDSYSANQKIAVVIGGQTNYYELHYQVKRDKKNWELISVKQLK